MRAKLCHMFLKIMKAAKQGEGAGGRGGQLLLKSDSVLKWKRLGKEEGNILMSVAA